MESGDMSFPRSDHKTDAIARILLYYLIMWMRQYCKGKRRDAQKQYREKKEVLIVQLVVWNRTEEATRLSFHSCWISFACSLLRPPTQFYYNERIVKTEFLDSAAFLQRGASIRYDPRVSSGPAGSPLLSRRALTPQCHFSLVFLRFSPYHAHGLSPSLFFVNIKMLLFIAVLRPVYMAVSSTWRIIRRRLNVLLSLLCCAPSGVHG